MITVSATTPVSTFNDVTQHVSTFNDVTQHDHSLCHYICLYIQWRNTACLYIQWRNTAWLLGVCPSSCLFYLDMMALIAAKGGCHCPFISITAIKTILMVQKWNPLDETIKRGPPCLYACKKIANTHYRSCQSLVDYENIKITQHALRVRTFRVLKLTLNGGRLKEGWRYDHWPVYTQIQIKVHFKQIVVFSRHIFISFP